MSISEDDICERLLVALQGRPINVVQRGPLVFVDATGPMTAATAFDLTRYLLPVVKGIISDACNPQR